LKRFEGKSKNHNNYEKAKDGLGEKKDLKQEDTP